MSLAVKANLLTGEQIIDYSKYGLGLPLLLIPFLFLNDVLHHVFGTIDSNLVLALPNVLILAAIAQVVFFIIYDMGYGYKKGLFLALLSTFGTFAFPYINFFFSELLQALCITFTFFCIYRAKKVESIKTSYLLFALGGMAYGYGVLTKAALLILLPLFVIYVLLSIRENKDKKLLHAVSAFLLTIAIFGIFISILNYSRFGSIFEFGYGKETNLFINPIAEGVFNFIINPDKSLFLFAPVMLLLPYVLWRFSKTFRGEGLLILSLVIVNLLFYSAWWSWEGGGVWGPRFLLTLVPISIIPFAIVLDQRFFKVAVSCLFIAGFFINFLGTIQSHLAYQYIIFKSTEGIELKVDRPKRDYIDIGNYKQVLPHIISFTLPQFSSIRGHLWLLRAKYEGWRNGYGLSNQNRTLRNPPWIDDFPQYQVPDIQKLDKEIGIRIDCPVPLLFSYFVCPDLKPSMPFYYDALINQANKAEILGYKDKALNLRRKAIKESYEKRRRIIQMNSSYL